MLGTADVTMQEIMLESIQWAVRAAEMHISVDCLVDTMNLPVGLLTQNFRVLEIARVLHVSDLSEVSSMDTAIEAGSAYVQEVTDGVNRADKQEDVADECEPQGGGRDN